MRSIELSRWRSHSRRWLLFAPTLGFVSLFATMGEEATGWNRFRGPNGSGVAPSHWQPPIQIDAACEAWRVPVPSGLSSPVIGGDRVFLTGVENGRLFTLAFDRETGALAWRREAPVTDLENVHETNSPAASTPLVANDSLVVYFGSFGLLCYDLEGNERWRKQIPTPESLYGMTSSPIVHDNLVILVLDSDRNLPESEVSESKILAVKLSDGETAWETPRPFSRSGWSTPSLRHHETEVELLVLGHGRLQAYDPNTGEGKWFVKGFSRETIAVPILGRDMVFASSSQLGGGGDLEKDPAPFWEALKPFDSNRDGNIERAEMIGDFTFPFRPELPPGHPGFGMPLPENPEKRKERIDWIVTWVDRNGDGTWTREEFFEGLKTGRGKPLLVAVSPGGKGDVTHSQVRWELNRGIPEIPSPIIHQDHIYLVRKGGLLSALRVEDGESLYRVRIPDAPGQYAASPVIANGHLYLVSSLGRGSVIRTGSTFELVHQFELGGASEATPAIDETTIYFRTDQHLIAFRSRRKDSP